MIGHSETRWALMAGDEFLGVHCWDSGQCDDQPRVRTFRTAKLAVAAKQGLNSYKKLARVVKVKLSIQ